MLSFNKKECKQQGIVKASIWGDGMMVMTKKSVFVVVSTFEEPNPRVMASPPLKKEPTAWEVIAPRFTNNGHPEVLVAAPQEDNGTIFVCDYDKSVDQKLDNGPFTCMAVSSNGTFLACFTLKGKLWLVSTDFSQNATEFDTKCSRPPTQMVWCGNLAVCLYWDVLGLLIVVGQRGDWISYKYNSPVHLVQEIDGVRVIGKTCDYIEALPKPIENIFSIGATSASAMLYDAQEHFEKKSPRADELIRYIGGELNKAIEECIAASRFEWNMERQKKLLKAASFGRSFIPTKHDPRSFVEACQSIRIINSIRNESVGMPITYIQ